MRNLFTLRLGKSLFPNRRKTSSGYSENRATYRPVIRNSDSLNPYSPRERRLLFIAIIAIAIALIALSSDGTDEPEPKQPITVQSKISPDKEKEKRKSRTSPQVKATSGAKRHNENIY